MLPWRGTEAARTARLICDVADPDGQPFAGDPRTNLKRVLREAADLGYTMNVGPEAEFFLFKLDGDGNPTVDPHDAATYFDVAPIDRGEDCRRDIEVTLQQMGFDLEAAHHEVAIGQHEIDFRHADALATADNLITFRMVVKMIAARHGMHATFMAKPIHGENGSGMHVNQSLARGRRERVPRRGRRAPALAGVPRLHRRASSTTCRRSPPSPTRRSTRTSGSCPGTRRRSTSPGRPATGRRRSACPAKRGRSTRIELRTPDPTANPYLALACMLARGPRRDQRGLTPPEPVNRNIYHLTDDESAGARHPAAFRTTCRTRSTRSRPTTSCAGRWATTSSPSTCD